MPFRFAFDPAHEMFYCEFSGEMNDKSLIDYYAAAAVHIRNTKPRMAVLEFKDITKVEVSTAALSLLADSPPILPALAKPRLLIAPTDVVYGECRAFEMMGGGTRPALQIVRTLEEAYSLLGVSNPQFEPLPDTPVSQQSIDHRAIAPSDKSR